MKLRYFTFRFRGRPFKVAAGGPCEAEQMIWNGFGRHMLYNAEFNQGNLYTHRDCHLDIAWEVELDTEKDFAECEFPAVTGSESESDALKLMRGDNRERNQDRENRGMEETTRKKDSVLDEDDALTIFGNAVDNLRRSIMKFEELEKLSSFSSVKAKETELEEKQKELHEREFNLERMERDMREHPGRYLFGNSALFLWEVNYRVVDPAKETKCSECDEAGYIHYLSPNGTYVRERCRCRWDHQEYYACRTRLVELHIRNGNEPVLFYKPEDKGDSFSTIMLDHDHRIYDGVQDFSELDPFRLLFLDEETARKYAEWCNEHRRTCVYNRVIQYEDK